MDVLCWCEHLVFLFVLVSVFNIWYRHGGQGLILALIQILKAGVPGLQLLINKVLHREAQKFTKLMNLAGDGKTRQRVALPKTGVPSKQLLEDLAPCLESTKEYREEGKIFGYLYGTGEDDFVKAQIEAFQLFGETTKLNEEHDKLVQAFHNTFLHQSAVNPTLFPTLRRFENEIIDMTSSILHGDDGVVGTLTSGGTESILMAIKTYRDRARKLYPHIKAPEMVAPVTIHPLHDKAAHYFGVRLIKVPVGENCLPDINQFEEAITENTIGLLCSAPQIQHGVVDPIESISYIALRKKLPLHVDATYGAFLLPWLSKLGQKVPRFDFEVPGVSSISTDIHKYGFGMKGCSVLLHRNADLRKFQIFSCSRWPGGFIASLSMAGTRGGAAIAAHWATLQSLGEQGYCDTAKTLMAITQRFKDGIAKIKEIRVVGEPSMSIIAVRSTIDRVDIFKIADLLEKKVISRQAVYGRGNQCRVGGQDFCTVNYRPPGWKQEVQQNLKAIKFSFQLCHQDVIEDLLTDIQESVVVTKQSSPSIHHKMSSSYMSQNKRALDVMVPQYYGAVYNQRTV